MYILLLTNTMVIIFKECNVCDTFRNYVTNPSDRKAQKAFRRIFDAKIESSSVRLFDRITLSSNAKEYNQLAGHNNKVELVSGCKDKEEQKFKVRVDSNYRKFFFYLCNEKCCLAENWDGKFELIESIYIYDINNHKYD